MADAEDRTLAASERKLLRAREDGQAAVSRELVAAAGLGAALLALAIGGPALLGELGTRLRGLLDNLAAPPTQAVRGAAEAWFVAAGPLLGLVALAGAGTVLLQTGFLIHGSAILPDLSRLDPRRGLHRVIGPANGFEALKALAKLSVLAWAVSASLRAAWPRLPGAARWTMPSLMEQLGRELMHVGVLVLAMQVGIAVLDLAWTRWQFARKLRMSREDQRQELREAEGDPRLKARLRQIRLTLGRRRMLAAVGQATVVVTNPTHYAVALAYNRGGSAAPRVVAKGVDDVAARIRAAATEAGVPIVANPPLARALYTVSLDAEVPAEHFKVVAEIIAYVWRLRGSAR